MKVVVDNCLPVSWAGCLREAGHQAEAWRDLGPANAPDEAIMRWAQAHGAVVLTHDLDFSRLLFQSRAGLPSVIQLRVDDVRPAVLGGTVAAILRDRAAELARGALITVTSRRSRYRLLPLDGAE